MGPARASILYGPFPMRMGRVFGALVALLVGTAAGALGLETEHLRCDFASQGACVVDWKLSFRSDVRFPSVDLRGARVETVRRGKGRGTEYGVVVLALSDREHRLLEVAPAEARAITRQIETARERRTNLEVDLSDSRWLLLVSVVCALMMVSMLWTAVRRMGALLLTLGYGGDLRVERRLLGVPISANTLSLQGVTDVGLEWTEEADFWRNRGEIPRRLGRIVLVTRNGPVPLTSDSWPGETLHFRAAAALRQTLGLSPGRIESELDALEAIRVRPAFARTNGGLFALCWAGACSGAILGLGVFLAVGFALGALEGSSGVEPWMVAVGSGGGAIAGVAFVLYLARPRAPR